MPQFYEVYGTKLDDHSHEALSIRQCGHCPYTEASCDGGGNRHQTGIKLTEDSPLREFFSDDLSKVVPGICSIEYGDAVWIVCPRRLLGFRDTTEGSDLPQVNFALKEHERSSLLAASLPTGVRMGVWAEVYLKFKEDDTDINYHFDFVIAPIEENTSMQWLLEYEGVSDQNDITDLIECAKKGKYLSGRQNLESSILVLPKLDNPVIVEVMTASTSGSKKELRTDIASSFEDALLGRRYNCPGINKRQVWGRMATQLFAKSALAEAWGGRTIWMVQDELLKNIALTTKLHLDQEEPAPASTINFLSLSYGEGEDSRSLSFDRYLERDAGLDFTQNNKAADILLPKTCPEKVELLKSVLRRRLSAIIEL